MEIEIMIRDIRNYIRDEINFSKNFDPHTNIIEEGIIDSMGILALVSFLESKYRIEIDLEEITAENFATVNKIAEFVMNVWTREGNKR